MRDPDRGAEVIAEDCAFEDIDRGEKLAGKEAYRGEDVVTTLDRTCRMIGYPKTIRVDQGSEFIFRDMDLWAYQRGVTLDFSRPGKR